MQVETPSIFAKVIQDHLELKERNAGLEDKMPLTLYKHEDPFDNHPLCKTEEHAGPSADEGLWSRSRDFDWGD